MKKNPQHEMGRSMSEAVSCVSKITSCCLAMVLPGIGGIWLDKKFNISPICSLIFLCFGLICGMYLLIKSLEKRKQK